MTKKEVRFHSDSSSTYNRLCTYCRLNPIIQPQNKHNMDVPHKGIKRLVKTSIKYIEHQYFTEFLPASKWPSQRRIHHTTVMGADLGTRWHII